MADNKEFELTGIDANQLPRYTYSEKHNAQRVVLVGGENLTINANMEQLKQPEPQIITIEKPIIVKEIEIREVEKPIIVMQETIREIEKPVIVKEFQIKEIEKPVFIERIVHVDRPVLVEKEKFVGFPTWLKICIIAQSIAMIGLFLIKLVK